MIKGTIERKEGTRAVIETTQREIITIPFDLLPAEAQIGSNVEIEIKINGTKKKPYNKDLFA